MAVAIETTVVHNAFVGIVAAISVSKTRLPLATAAITAGDFGVG